MALFPLQAKAVPVTVEFQGGIFGLELIESLGSNQYVVQYSADLTGFDPYVGAEANWDQYINAVAFKVGTEVVGAVVVATNFGASGDWNPVELSGWMSGSGIGCSSGSSDAICADVEPYLAPATTGLYTWNFRLTTSGGVPTVYGQPIRAEFLNAAGEHSGLLSMTTAQVPEPASLTLLGLGLFGAGIVARRRR